MKYSVDILCHSFPYCMYCLKWFKSLLFLLCDSKLALICSLLPHGDIISRAVNFIISSVQIL